MNAHQSLSAGILSSQQQESHKSSSDIVDSTGTSSSSTASNGSASSSSSAASNSASNNNIVNEIVKLNNAAVEGLSVKKFPLSQASEILLRALSMMGVMKSLNDNNNGTSDDGADGVLLEGRNIYRSLRELSANNNDVKCTDAKTVDHHAMAKNQSSMSLPSRLPNHSFSTSRSFSTRTLSSHPSSSLSRKSKPHSRTNSVKSLANRPIKRSKLSSSRSTHRHLDGQPQQQQQQRGQESSNTTSSSTGLSSSTHSGSSAVMGVRQNATFPYLNAVREYSAATQTAATNNINNNSSITLTNTVNSAIQTTNSTNNNNNNDNRSQDVYDEGMNMYSSPLQVPDIDSNSNLGFPSVLAALLFNLGLVNLQRDQDDDALIYFSLAADVVSSNNNDHCSLSGNNCSLAFFSNNVSNSISSSSNNTNSNNHTSNNGSSSTSVLSTREEIALLHNIAYIHYRRRNYDLALAQFTRVYHLAAEKFGHIGDFSVASALNCIGVVLFHMREAKYGDVNDILVQSLSIRQNLLRYAALEADAAAVPAKSNQGDSEKEDVDDVHVATTLNNIGRVHFDSGNYSRALVYYQQSLAMRRRLLGKDHVDVSATSFNAGQTYHKLGQLKEAIEHYHEFYRITSKKYGYKHDLSSTTTTGAVGGAHRDLVIVLKHLGQAYHEKQESIPALEYYTRALQASRQVAGHFNREAASILNMLGNLAYESGDFDKAIEVYEDGLAVERVVLAKNCVNIVVTLSNIGQALMQKGDYAGALCKYTEAYTIQCTFTEKNVKKITETLSIIGQISSMLGKYAQAQRAFTEVVFMRRRALGDHVDVALALNYLGLVNFKQGALDMAMENFQESLRVRKVCCEEDGGDIAVLLYNIASIYLHRGDNDMALKFYQDALEVEKASLGESHPDVAVTLKLIGKVYDRCGQFEEAIDYYSEALEVYRRCVAEVAESDAASSTSPEGSHKMSETLKEHKLNTGRLLALIASIYLRQANTEKMTETISEAYRIYLEVGAPVEELELAGFNLYELSMLHPECAAAA